MARATPVEIEYPSSDGKPMAETEIHLLVMFAAIEVLRSWYVRNSQVWVGGNQLLYYVKGDRRKCSSPDVMVSLGIPKEPMRDTYLVWHEGKAPDVVVEVTSRKTRKRDKKVKFFLYRDVLKVREYFLFDPLLDYLKPPLQGYRLVKGEYLPIAAVDGRLPSDVLNLHLERDDWQLRFYDPAAGVWLKTSKEVRETLQQETEARKKAERVRKRAEAAQQKAEAELERLRQELEALKKRSR
jgi:Uma2 family endonuclease